MKRMLFFTLVAALMSACSSGSTEPTAAEIAQAVKEPIDYVNENLRK